MNGRIKIIDDSPQIRAALPEDLGTILNVEQSAFPPNRQASLDTFRNRLELFPQGFLVVEQDGTIIGFETSLLTLDMRSLRELDQPDEMIHTSSGIVYYLRSLAIQKEFQRRGIGKALTDEALKLAKALNKKVFRLTAARDVEQFYTKLGFQRITEYQDFHGIPQAIWELKL